MGQLSLKHWKKESYTIQDKGKSSEQKMYREDGMHG